MNSRVSVFALWASIFVCAAAIILLRPSLGHALTYVCVIDVPGTTPQQQPPPPPTHCIAVPNTNQRELPKWLSPDKTYCCQLNTGCSMISAKACYASYGLISPGTSCQTKRTQERGMFGVCIDTQ